MTLLKDATAHGWVHDIGIFSAKYRVETGRRCFQVVRKEQGKVVCEWSDSDSSAKGIVPAYTSTISMALLVWPDDIRPKMWGESAIDCCIAGLAAIRSRIVTAYRDSHKVGEA